MAPDWIQNVLASLPTARGEDCGQTYLPLGTFGSLQRVEFHCLFRFAFNMAGKIAIAIFPLDFWVGATLAVIALASAHGLVAPQTGLDHGVTTSTVIAASLIAH